MSDPNSFAKKLRRPYYLETRLSKRWLHCLQFGLFVFLFLIIFQPFGLSSFKGGIAAVASGFGITTFLVMAILNIAVFTVFPVYFSEQKWNVLRELYWNMLNVLIIGLANVAYSAFIGMVPLTLYTALIFEMYTVSVAVLPITLMVLLKESRLNKKFAQQSREINSEIKEHKAEQQDMPAEKISILIPAENEKDKLALALNDLLFIQSSDNYVEVHYFQKNELRKKLLRNSLKAIALHLEEHKSIFRCHKSYLVNIQKVEHVSGNAQGYKLHLRGTSFLIPVSRQNNELLRTQLAAHPRT